MTEAEPPFEHPLRSRTNVPRSDLRRATTELADALDKLLATHAPTNAGGSVVSLELDDEVVAKVVKQLRRCVGGRIAIRQVAVGDVVLQIVCDDEAGAASVSAVVNHTGLGGKASWFKSSELAWVVLVVPTR